MTTTKSTAPRQHSDRKRRLCCLLLFVLLLWGDAWLYLADSYHADARALAVLADPAPGVTVTEAEDRQIVFAPEEARAGLIFYPGGKVEYTAYAPLMEACARKGFLCVLLHMPGNLAVLDADAAADIPARFPQVKRWYLAGHSLGGTIAASYLGEHTEDFAGLILLAAYPTVDLSESDVSLLSVYGSEDGVLNREKYNADRANWPADAREAVIDGGCHAYFGCYGSQERDGVPGISNEEQLLRTADLIAAFAA